MLKTIRPLSFEFYLCLYFQGIKVFFLCLCVINLDELIVVLIAFGVVLSRTAVGPQVSAALQ